MKLELYAHIPKDIRCPFAGHFNSDAVRFYHIHFVDTLPFCLDRLLTDLVLLPTVDTAGVSAQQGQLQHCYYGKPGDIACQWLDMMAKPTFHSQQFNDGVKMVTECRLVLSHVVVIEKSYTVS